MGAVVPQMLSRLAGKLVRVVCEPLMAAAGQFIAELCAESERLDDKRQIAVLKRQLESTSASACRWHMRAMDLQAVLDLRDGPTVELTNLVEKPANEQSVFGTLPLKRAN
jgi:hypothetical protein